MQGYSNHQAVEVLKRTGKTVRLKLIRYLRGYRYEQLQHAIASSDIPAETAARPTSPAGEAGAVGGAKRRESPTVAQKPQASPQHKKERSSKPSPSVPIQPAAPHSVKSQSSTASSRKSSSEAGAEKPRGIEFCKHNNNQFFYFFLI